MSIATSVPSCANAVVDADGKPISSRCIVQVIDLESMLSECQGVVMDPRSTIAGGGFCVAVFFNLEVDQHHFYFTSPSRFYEGIESVRNWDATHGRRCAEGNVEFLFENDEWKRCPRIIYFRPQDLAVRERWDIKVMADRVFGKNYHHYEPHLIGASFPQDPSAYQCWIEGCARRGSKIALYNFWGSILAYCTCDECFVGIHGYRGESDPKCKKQILFADGTPIPTSK